MKTNKCKRPGFVQSEMLTLAASTPLQLQVFVGGHGVSENKLDRVQHFLTEGQQQVRGQLVRDQCSAKGNLST